MLAEVAHTLMQAEGFEPSDSEYLERFLSALETADEGASVPYHRDGELTVHIFFDALGDNLVVETVFYGIRGYVRDEEVRARAEALADAKTAEMKKRFGEPDDRYDAGGGTYFLTWFVDPRFADDSLGGSTVRMTEEQGKFDLVYRDYQISRAVAETRRFIQPE